MIFTILILKRALKKQKFIYLFNFEKTEISLVLKFNFIPLNQFFEI